MNKLKEIKKILNQLLIGLIIFLLISIFGLLFGVVNLLMEYPLLDKLSCLVTILGAIGIGGAVITSIFQEYIPFKNEYNRLKEFAQTDAKKKI